MTTDSGQAAPWVVEVEFESEEWLRETIFDRLMEVMACEYPDLDVMVASRKRPDDE